MLSLRGIYIFIDIKFYIPSVHVFVAYTFLCVHGGVATEGRKCEENRLRANNEKLLVVYLGLLAKHKVCALSAFIGLNVFNLILSAPRNLQPRRHFAKSHKMLIKIKSISQVVGQWGGQCNKLHQNRVTKLVEWPVSALAGDCFVRF